MQWVVRTRYHSGKFCINNGLNPKPALVLALYCWRIMEKVLSLLVWGCVCVLMLNGKDFILVGMGFCVCVRGDTFLYLVIFFLGRNFILGNNFNSCILVWQLLYAYGILTLLENLLYFKSNIENLLHSNIGSLLVVFIFEGVWGVLFKFIFGRQGRCYLLIVKQR